MTAFQRRVDAAERMRTPIVQGPCDSVSLLGRLELEDLRCQAEPRLGQVGGQVSHDGEVYGPDRVDVRFPVPGDEDETHVDADAHRRDQYAPAESALGSGSNDREHEERPERAARALREY